ncbi:MAG: hypothetical protein R3C05_30250 [Pirellulaceae bacterium]
MTKHEQDPQRLAACVASLRRAVRLSPVTFIPLVGISFGLVGAIFGVVWFVLLLSVGALLGFFLSQIIAAAMETLALILIRMNQSDESSD